MVNMQRINRMLHGNERMLVSASESIRYLTGRCIDPGERMLALVIGGGEVLLFVNRLFAQRGEAGMELIEYDDVDDPIGILSDRLPGGELGIDPCWPSGFLLRLMELRPDIIPKNCGPSIVGARMLKDAEERQLMKESSRLNDLVTGELIASLRVGMSEKEAGELYLKIARSHGAGGYSFKPLVCFGANCAEPHHVPDDTRLEEGQAVIIDVGLEKDGYMSDITRSLYFGRADDEYKRVYDIVKKANEAGRNAVRPGACLGDIDRAAREIIESAGYGKYFTHRTGHGIGLEVHEQPDVSAASKATAQPGMVFSIEPGIYLPGKFGVRIEDLMLVTEDASECLNRLERDIIEID